MEGSQYKNKFYIVTIFAYEFYFVSYLDATGERFFVVVVGGGGGEW